jgi:hypothetical protein
LGSRALRLVPRTEMAQDGGQVACEAVAQPQGPVMLRCDQICFTIHEQFSR